MTRLAATTGDPSCGAVVLFVGTVRNRHRDRRVEGITYDAYRSMAADKLESIAANLEESFRDLRIRIVHRLGEIPSGDALTIECRHVGETGQGGFVRYDCDGGTLYVRYVEKS